MSDIAKSSVSMNDHDHLQLSYVMIPAEKIDEPRDLYDARVPMNQEAFVPWLPVMPFSTDVNGIFVCIPTGGVHVRVGYWNRRPTTGWPGSCASGSTVAGFCMPGKSCFISAGCRPILLPTSITAWFRSFSCLRMNDTNTNGC